MLYQLSYSRHNRIRIKPAIQEAGSGPFCSVVEGGGFEPPKASPTDLQSVPFDRSGTPPCIKKASCSPKALPTFMTHSPNRPALLPAWSWRWDLNPQPADYKSAALPIELRQPCETGDTTPFAHKQQPFFLQQPYFVTKGGWRKEVPTRDSGSAPYYLLNKSKRNAYYSALTKLLSRYFSKAMAKVRYTIWANLV